MNKYITREQLAELLEQCWNAGVRVEFRPAANEVCITKSDDSGYEWLHVMNESSIPEIMSSVTGK